MDDPSKNAAHKPSKNELHIQLDDDIAQGTYVNLAMVNHTETEFILDFIYVQPQQPRAKVRSRLLSSPKHTKRLLMAMQDNVKKYEAKFGEINIGTPMPTPDMKTVLN